MIPYNVMYPDQEFYVFKLISDTVAFDSLKNQITSSAKSQLGYEPELDIYSWSMETGARLLLSISEIPEHEREDLFDKMIDAFYSSEDHFILSDCLTKEIHNVIADKIMQKWKTMLIKHKANIKNSKNN